MAGKSKLTPKQKLFISAYLIDLNATRAAIAAGYSRDTAKQMGSENLAKPDVAEEIQKRMDRRAEKLEITSDKVLQEIALLGFANMADFIVPQEDCSILTDFSSMTREQAAAIQEVTVEEYVEGKGENARQCKRVKFKLCDKGANLERLGKHLKLFVDRVEFHDKTEPEERQRAVLDILREGAQRVGEKIQ